MRCALALLILGGCHSIQLPFRGARRAKAPPTPRPGATARIFRADDHQPHVLNLDFVPRVGWRGTVFPAVVSCCLLCFHLSGHGV